MPTANYDSNVFINCPFDETYRTLFESLVFAVHDCGFIARCSREADDAGTVRIEKIFKIISDCKLGIHDISRTEPDASTRLPRFNMPLELGIFLGAKRFGRGEQKNKILLILDIEPYRFQKFISDIAGQDISAHHGESSRAIKVVRNWLSNAAKASVAIPGGAHIVERYLLFRKELPFVCKKLKLDVNDLTFNNYVVLVEEWLKFNAQIPG